MATYAFRLFVTGRSPQSQRAVANLRRLCDEHLDGTYDLDVIDVLERPQAAETDRVLATPTLDKAFPPPPRRLVGDLADPQKVIAALDLAPGRLTRPDNGS